MNIWKVSLVFNTYLSHDKKLFIDCTKESGEFQDYLETNSYISGSGRYTNIISKDARLERTQDSYIVEKGFTYEPNESELLELKEEMIKIVIDRIEMEKESYLTRTEYSLLILNESLNDKTNTTNMFD